MVPALLRLIWAKNREYTDKRIMVASGILRLFTKFLPCNHYLKDLKN
jgi:hypothetical protein